MNTKNEGAIITGIKKLSGFVKAGGAPFWRLLALVVVVGLFVVLGLAAFKGCEWTGKNSHLKIKSAPRTVIQ